MLYLGFIDLNRTVTALCNFGCEWDMNDIQSIKMSLFCHLIIQDTFLVPDIKSNIFTVRYIQKYRLTWNTLPTLSASLWSSIEIVNTCNFVFLFSNASEPFQINLTASCNFGCECDMNDVQPVCGANGLTYFSPCHAGCTSLGANSDNYTNCACKYYTAKTLTFNYFEVGNMNFFIVYA